MAGNRTQVPFVITPTLAVLILIIIISIVLAITFFTTPDSFRSGRGSTFFACLAGFSIIIIFFFYYMLVSLNTKQQEILLNQESYQLNALLTASLVGDMRRVAEYDPEFVKTLNPLLPCPSGDIKACVETGGLAYNIFTSWQQSLRYEDFETNCVHYLCNYLQRANSPELYGYWVKMKLNFNWRTQDLGDLLFEYGLPLKGHLPLVYEKAALELSCDSRFQALFA